MSQRDPENASCDDLGVDRAGQTHEHRSHRMPAVRFRAGHPGQADAPGGGAALPRSDGQRPRGGRGDGADGVEQLRRDPGQRDLGVLDVGDQATAQHHAGAGTPARVAASSPPVSDSAVATLWPPHGQIGDERAGVVSDQRVVHANP